MLGQEFHGLVSIPPFCSFLKNSFAYAFLPFKLLIILINTFTEPFRQFYADHAHLFIDAPAELSGEQNLEYYSLYQKYLVMYEDKLSDYIQSLDVSITEFYRELAAIREDPEIKDKKLLYFVEYLIACTDYPSFYKVMTRAAKKLRAQELGWDENVRAESKSESKSPSRYEEKGGSSGAKDYK